MRRILRQRALMFVYSGLLLLAGLITAQATTTTYTWTANSSTYTAVTAQSDCTYIQVVEDAGAATVNLLIKAPATGNSPVTIPAGQTFTFIGPYSFGDTAGFLKSASTSPTIAQREF